MTCITHIRHILRRDGTNQFDRLPVAFNPGYVKIDEKSTADLLQLISSFASHVQFYNRQNLKDGDWQGFFDDFSREHEPHIALMLTFLKLFGEARDHLNEIGKRHLDYYYSRFLQIQKRAAQPDKAHLIVETARNINVYKLPKNTKFSGGKDQTGKPLTYVSEREIVLNKAAVGSVKSVFVNRERQHAVFSAPVADSADGQGKAFDNQESMWSAFGDSQDGLSPAKQTMLPADIGFAISSPTLWLREGERKITLTIKLQEPAKENGLTLKNLLSRNLDDSLKASLTCEEGWLENVVVNVSYKPINKQLILTIELSADQPAVVAFDESLHTGAFAATQPVLKILANKEAAHHPHVWLRSLRFSQIAIHVKVDGLQSLVLHNDLGPVDSKKPFQPFGPLPVKGSAFYIGSAEAFSKKITKLKLRLLWKDLPDNPNGFKDHYHSYPSKFDNKSFTVSVSALNKAKWVSEFPSDKKRLFNEKTETFKITGRGTFTFSWLLTDEVTRNINVSAFGLEQKSTMPDLSKYDYTVKSGFLRLQLAGKDFGHKDYPETLTKQTVLVSNALIIDPEAKTPALPNPPYTPLLDHVKLDYEAESFINFEAAGTTAGNSFLHVSPFGVLQKKNRPAATNELLVPRFDKQGYFYIGFEDLNPPQNISVLFQIAEDSADAERIEPETKIKWSYLGIHGWTELGNNDIVSDSTNGFLKTGIIIFNVPKDAVDNSTEMPGNQIWLRAAYGGDVRGINKMIGLYAQAVTVVFDDQDNDPAHYSDPLPHGTIDKLLSKDFSIKKITQPFASFGGKKPETGGRYPVDYYTRVSERLRHKNRGVTVWDIERLVLGAFPNIYKVKALNHASDKNDIAPGNITVVVIEKIRNKNAVNPLQPRTGSNVLQEIKSFLVDHTSPFVEVFAQNPIYEEIQVSCKVGFKPGFDPGYYAAKLNEDIKQFLSPWAYHEGEDIIFGNVIYKSSIHYFVEKREYIDYVIDFQMSHIKPSWGIGCMEILDDFYVGNDDTSIDVDKATPKTSRSILVSANDHQIGIISGNTGI